MHSLSRGFTLTELMVATAIGCILAYLVATLLYQGAAMAAATQSLGDLITFRTMLNSALIKSLNCQSVMGGGIQTVNPTIGSTTPISIYEIGSTPAAPVVMFQAAPAAGQNMYGSTWRWTSVNLEIIGGAPTGSMVNVIRFANIVITGVPTSPTMRAVTERFPLQMTLNQNNPSAIIDCFGTDQEAASTVAPPTCIPGQKLFFSPLAAGLPPQWSCVPL